MGDTSRSARGRHFKRSIENTWGKVWGFEKKTQQDEEKKLTKNI